jgi:SP family general alpha glucoside:H+ symporter-like MFS transporter
MYNTTAGNLGGKCGYFFAGLSIICIFVVYFFVPETFGRSYAELDEIFEEGISARQSSTYVCKGAITHSAAAPEKGNVTLAEEAV